MSEQLIKYRENIKDARNQLIAHADKATILAGQPVGAHDSSLVTIFFEALKSYCDEVGNAVGVGPLDFNTQAGRGDVLDLITVLKYGKS